MVPGNWEKGYLSKNHAYQILAELTAVPCIHCIPSHAHPHYFIQTCISFSSGRQKKFIIFAIKDQSILWAPIFNVVEKMKGQILIICIEQLQRNLQFAFIDLIFRVFKLMGFDGFKIILLFFTIPLSERSWHDWLQNNNGAHKG